MYTHRGQVGYPKQDLFMYLYIYIYIRIYIGGAGHLSQTGFNMLAISFSPLVIAMSAFNLGMTTQN